MFKYILEKNKNISIVFTGDSITHGPLHTKGYRSYTEHFRERLKEKYLFEERNSLVKVFNTGVSGATTKDILRDFHRCIEVYEPRIVFIMLGMNDCSKEDLSLKDYRENIIDIICKIQKIGALPCIQTSNTIKEDISRKKLGSYMEVLREVAEEKNIFLIDHYYHWKALEKIDINIKEKLLNDSIHPNEVGHLEIAKYIFKCLNIFDENSYTCSLKYPIEHNYAFLKGFNYKSSFSKEVFEEEVIKLKNIIKEDKEGVWLFLDGGPLNVVGNTLGYKNYVEYLEERIRWELNGDSIKKREKFMINLGKKNMNIEYILNNFHEMISKYEPKVVFLMISKEDDFIENLFEDNLRKIINNIKNIGAISVIQSSPIDNYYKVKRIEKVCKDEKVVFIDNYKLFRSLEENIQGGAKIFFEDNKLNEIGHLFLAKNIFRLLGIYDSKSLICNFEI